MAFRWKDYRIKHGDRQKVHVARHRRVHPPVPIHVLPDGFHRIRHYGLLASVDRGANIAKIRTLLGATQPVTPPEAAVESVPLTLREPCPCCGAPMRIIEIFRRGQTPRSRAPLQEQVA